MKNLLFLDSLVVEQTSHRLVYEQRGGGLHIIYTNNCRHISEKQTSQIYKAESGGKKTDQQELNQKSVQMLFTAYRATSYSFERLHFSFHKFTTEKAGMQIFQRRLFTHTAIYHSVQFHACIVQRACLMRGQGR